MYSYAVSIYLPALLHAIRHALLPQVKYTWTYSQPVHDAWSQGGVAPRLLRVDPLPGGWLAVFMEWLQLRDGWVLLGLAPQPWAQEEEEQVQQQQAGSSGVGGSQMNQSPAAAVLSALDELRAGMTEDVRTALCSRVMSRLAHAHSLAIGVGGGVLQGAGSVGGSSTVVGGSSGARGAHGDMRLRNIMLQLRPSEPPTTDIVQQLSVKFIDFDWAGTVGEARYPLFINKEVSWLACHIAC